MMAFGSDSSFSMHSLTIRRATRLVEATRGITAIDSMVVSRSTRRRVSMLIADTSLILHQLLDAIAQLRLTRLCALHDRRRRVRHELFVSELGVERRQLVAALFQFALRPLL